MDEGCPNVCQRNQRVIKSLDCRSASIDVIQYRLEHEYGAKCDYEPLSIHKACWIEADKPEALQAFISRKKKDIAYDSDHQPVFLAESAWVLKMTQETFRISNSISL
jgi:peptide chain release factor 3